MEGRRPKHVRDTAQRQWLRERTNDQRLCSLREVSVCGQRAWALRPGRGRWTPESVAHERKCFLLRRPFADRSGPQPTDEDVAPEECPSVVRRMNRAQSAASEPLEQIRLYADKDAMVAPVTLEAPVVQLAGVVEHRVVGRGQHRLLVDLLDDNRRERKDDVRLVADVVRLLPGWIVRWTVELADGETFRLEQVRGGRHARSDAGIWSGLGVGAPPDEAPTPAGRAIRDSRRRYRRGRRSQLIPVHPACRRHRRRARDLPQARAIGPGEDLHLPRLRRPRARGERADDDIGPLVAVHVAGTSAGPET